MSEANGAGNLGAHFNDGRTEFRIWAPDVEAVSVVIAGGDTVAMQKGEHGIFCLNLPVGIGTCYRYKFADGVTAPDPASRYQNGDVDDDSIVVDRHYNWQNPDWQGRPWHEVVIYELHVGSFGGFAGTTKELPRLAALGITAVELMPVAEFPGRHSWGYDGVLHYAPDAAYGTPQELKHLIDVAHGLGLMVFLDVVYNHFGPAGNYLNAYAKSFFRNDIDTPWGSAIDYRKPPVRRFYIENALSWLNDYRFDGLRFDAVSMVKDATFLKDMAAEIKAQAGERHVHLVVENEYNESGLLSVTPGDKKFDAQWTDDWHHAMHVLLTGETEGYYEDFLEPAQQLARCMAEGFYYQGERSTHANGTPRGTLSGHLPPTAFIIFLQNHDQIGNRAMGDRLTTLIAPDRLRAATFLLLMTPQIPMVFMGEEWGETKPFLFFADHEDPDLQQLIREGRRKEFGHFAAFKNPAMREKIPDPNAHATFTAAIPQYPIVLNEDQQAMLDLYQATLALRASHIVPRIPGAVTAGAQPLGERGVRASWTMGDGAMLTLAANFGDEPLPCEAGAGDLLASQSTAPFADGTLPPNSAFAWLQAK